MNPVRIDIPRIRPRAERRGRPGFTLVEVLFSVAVLALLIGLLIVGLQVATRVSRKAVEQQAVASMMIGCEQFKNDFGFAVPLIEDNTGPWSFTSGQDPRVGPLFSVAGVSEPVAYLSTTDMATRFPREDRFLRGREPDSEGSVLERDDRFSTHSLAYYLLGALGVDPAGPGNPPVDGVKGAGFMTPNRDGTFRKTGGKKYEPLFDTTKGTQGLVEVDAATGRFELRDRRGIAYRYYSWRHGRQYNPGQKPEIREPADLNIPRILGDPADDPQLRSAEYAIVAAGANRVFGDFWTDVNDGTETMQQIKDGMGVSQGMSDDRAVRMGREDNIVQVGR